MTVRHSRGMVSFQEARRKILDGEDSPREFLERCLETIEAREPVVKAFVTLDLEGARAAADAATARYRAGRPLSYLDGCPIGIKDIIETRDLPTGFGSRAFSGTRTTRDAACVQALKNAGAVIVGKTVTTEFAIGYSGPTTNPHDPTRTPGGSSSGSAAAVGAGMLPVALGTQTQGSMLRPASYCGAVGFKGTLGALPMGGIHPLSASHDHLGVFGATLADAWSVASWLSAGFGSPNNLTLSGAGEAPPAPVKPKRLVRLYTSGWEKETDEATKAAFEELLGRLRAAGVEIVDRTTEPVLAELETQLDAGIQGSLDMVAYEMRWPYLGYVEQHGDAIGERIRGLMKRSLELSAADYDALLAKRDAGREATRTALRTVGADGFVTLAASGPAPVGLQYTGSRTFLVYWSWLGFPAFSLPLISVGELPLGLQVMHLDHRDGDLCALANWLVREFA